MGRKSERTMAWPSLARRRSRAAGSASGRRHVVVRRWWWRGLQCVGSIRFGMAPSAAGKVPTPVPGSWELLRGKRGQCGLGAGGMVSGWMSRRSLMRASGSTGPSPWIHVANSSSLLSRWEAQLSREAR